MTAEPVVRADRHPLRLLSEGLAVAAGYYLACQVGLRFRLPGATPSIFWPPNAVLTSALLLSHPKRWPFLLLCVLPVHLLVELPTWPLHLVLILFCTNSLEALVGAGGVWWLSDNPTNLNTVSRFAIFVASAVVAGPVVSSFPDAAAVHAFVGDSFAHGWQERTLSNILTELVVVPAILGLAATLPGWFSRRWTRRSTEALLLAVGLVASGLFEFSAPGVKLPQILLISSQSPLVPQLPFLLWAAVRFGPAGAGMALLETTLVSAWHMVGGHGPFAGVEPTEAVEALSFFLAVQSGTLLCLATVVQERTTTVVALRASESIKSAILQSLTPGVVVVDRHARVLTFNDSWARLAPASQCGPITIGDDLVATLKLADRQNNPVCRAISRGVTLVLDGSRTRFSRDRLTDPGPPPRWWSVFVVRLDSAAGGSVVTLTDVTDVRHAELESERTRGQLAHVARVSTVGELTASIAHQLNQPLSAILANAEAARRILENPHVDTRKLSAIVLDIIKDDRRAGETIRRLRDLLQKGESQITRLDLGRLVQDVIDLTSSEANLRSISFRLDFDHAPIIVDGDSIQLQQLLLNLLQNAFEAMKGPAGAPKVIEIACHMAGGRWVHLSVRDMGPGLTAGLENQIFEPFYTTKPHGMGIGLSIVRSILEAHGGLIHAGSHVEGGAVFHVWLPLPDEGAASVL